MFQFAFSGDSDNSGFVEWWRVFDTYLTFIHMHKILKSSFPIASRAIDFAKPPPAHLTTCFHITPSISTPQHTHIHTHPAATLYCTIHTICTRQIIYYVDYLDCLCLFTLQINFLV